MNRIAVYTAVFGGYDKVLDPSVVTPGCDYYAFTDRPIKSKVWNNIKLKPSLDPTRSARKLKILGHDLLRTYEYTVWVDGNVDIVGDVRKLIADFGDFELLTFKHPTRDCIYDEADACAEYMKDDVGVIRSQIEFLHSEGYPRSHGLIESNVIIRRETPAVRAVMNTWWSMVSSYSKRDQLSFNYAAYKNGFDFHVMGECNARGSSSFFLVRKDHESHRRMAFRLKRLLRYIRIN